MPDNTAPADQDQSPESSAPTAAPPDPAPVGEVTDAAPDPALGARNGEFALYAGDVRNETAARFFLDYYLKRIIIPKMTFKQLACTVKFFRDIYKWPQSSQPPG